MDPVLTPGRLCDLVQVTLILGSIQREGSGLLPVRGGRKPEPEHVATELEAMRNDSINVVDNPEMTGLCWFQMSPMLRWGSVVVSKPVLGPSASHHLSEAAVGTNNCGFLFSFL